MAITAQQVKELREKTGAGMMDCKKALTESDGNFEKAIEILRKKGASVAAKRAERTANEGIVLTNVYNDGKSAAILEVNCETDFVAKSDDFIAFANSVMDTLLKNKPANVESLLECDIDGKKLADLLNDVIGKIGEKIEVSRFALEEISQGLLVDYVHHGSKLAVLVKSEGSSDKTNDLQEVLRDIAMQAAAMKPQFLNKEEVPSELIEKEIEIYKEVARKEGKPEQILEKIAVGKLNKYYEEVCLLEQAFIKDNAKKVKNVVEDFNKNTSSNIQVTKFYRFHLSDEKK